MRKMSLWHRWINRRIARNDLMRDLLDWYFTARDSKDPDKHKAAQSKLYGSVHMFRVWHPEVH